MSRVTCHVSRVTCHMSLFSFSFGQSGEAYWWRVCYQRGLPRLVFIIKATTNAMSFGHLLHNPIINYWICKGSSILFPQVGDVWYCEVFLALLFWRGRFCSNTEPFIWLYDTFESLLLEFKGTQLVKIWIWSSISLQPNLQLSLVFKSKKKNLTWTFGNGTSRNIRILFPQYLIIYFVNMIEFSGLHRDYFWFSCECF